MRQDQVIQVLHKVIAESQNFTTWTVSTPHLVALVRHVIEAEREACAQIADEWSVGYPHPSTIIAAAIRARGEQT